MLDGYNVEDKTDFSAIFSLLDKKKLNSRNVKSMFTFDSTKFNGISSVELLHTQTGQRVGNSLVRVLEGKESNLFIQSLAKLTPELQGKAFKEQGLKSPRLAFSMLKEQLRNTKQFVDMDKRNFIGPMNLMKVQDMLPNINGFGATESKLIGSSQDAMSFWKSKKVNTFFRRLGFKRHSIMSKDLESEIPSTVAFEFPKTWSDKSSAIALDKSQVKTFALENSKSPLIERSTSTLTPNIVENRSIQNTLINNKSSERTIFNTGIKDATMVSRSNASSLIQGTSKISTMKDKILSRVLK